VKGVHVLPTLEGGVVLERQIGASRWALDVDRDLDVLVVVVPPTGPSRTSEPTSVGEAAESLREFLAEATEQAIALT
jgi:hypothetical protein